MVWIFFPPFLAVQHDVDGIRRLLFVLPMPKIHPRINIMVALFLSKRVSVQANDLAPLAGWKLDQVAGIELAIVPPLLALRAWPPIHDLVEWAYV